MKKISVLAAFLVLLAAALPGQIRLNGYFSSDYIQTLNKSSGRGSSFGNPAAGLIVSGEWTPQFNYVLEMRTGAEWKPEIEQAWAGWIYSDAFRARLGLFLVPFGRMNEANRPYQTMLAAYPYPYGEVYPASWREIGVLVEGRTGVFRYAAYIGNGLAEADTLAHGQQFSDNNKNKAYGLRATLGLSQELEIGGSYYRGRQDAANTRNLVLYGADAAWVTKNVHCTAEYTRADVDNPAPFARGRTEGWNVQLGLNFDQLTPVVAYAKSKSSDPFHGLGWTDAGAIGAGILANHDRWALGATYALYANILLKLEYDIQKDTVLGRKDNVLRVQAAVHF
jgi:hypothetical protein